MTKLDKLTEINKLEKENRKIRLEDKLGQQEYYGEIEELFDPITKTLNTNKEQTLRAIDWQNEELYKQTKAIQGAPSQFNEALIKSNEALRKSNEAVEEARDKPRIIVDKDAADNNNLMTIQFKPQLKSLLGNLDFVDFEMNGVKVIYQENLLIVKHNISEFS